MICVAVTYVIKPGHEDEAVRLFEHRDRGDPSRARLQVLPGPPIDHRPPAVLPLRAVRRPRRPRRPPRAPHFETYVKNGLFTILESCAPELYEPIGSFERARTTRCFDAGPLDSTRLERFERDHK